MADDAAYTLVGDTTTAVLLWTAVIGYILVLVLALPLLIGANGNNYVIVGMIAFTAILGVATFNAAIAAVQGVSVVLLNIGWITLLYQTGYFYRMQNRILNRWRDYYGKRRNRPNE